MSVHYVEAVRFLEAARSVLEQDRARTLSTITDPRTRVKFQVVHKGGKYFLRTPRSGELIGPFNSIGELVKQIGI